ncbi:hypothetical protein JL720_9739 [Aureococcus anophagefferens]|nr:hypothetical protein JL720_9739 [Aureococcus anophagefferens]
MNEASNRPVVCEYRPDGVWLWTKWRGTVLEMTILPAAATMAPRGPTRSSGRRRTLSNGVADGGVADGDEVDDLGFANKEEDAIGPKLLSPEGLQGLVDAGQLTLNERDALLATRLPPSQYAFILLEWVGQYAMAGLEAGTLRGGPGFEAELFKQLTQVRAELFSISDFAAGRMPSGGSRSRSAGCSLFFKGLEPRSFLYPFGNEGFPGQNIRVDVLVSELNFGAQSRWSAAGAVLPTRDADGPKPTDTGIRYQSDLARPGPRSTSAARRARPMLNAAIEPRFGSRARGRARPRRLKPSNVLLHDGAAVFIDFELAGPNYRGRDISSSSATNEMAPASDAELRFIAVYLAEGGADSGDAEAARCLAESKLSSP